MSPFRTPALPYARSAKGDMSMAGKRRYLKMCMALLAPRPVRKVKPGLVEPELKAGACLHLSQHIWSDNAVRVSWNG
jgi:hypothetical protein